jgi:TIGR03009 family protein
MLKPAAAGLAVSSLCLSFIAEIPAQTTGTRKKSPLVQTQGEADAPATRKSAPLNTDPNAGERPAAKTKSGKLPPPAPQEFRIEAVSPELEKILQDWERNTARFKKLVGEFTVFKYETTFEIERRGEGKFAYEAPDKGDYVRRGIKIEKGQKSQKMNKDGEPYTLQTDSAERWVCTGKEIIRIDEKEKTYEKLPIPLESQGENIIEGPLPFLFGMKAQQAKMRYKMKLLKQDDAEIKLQVIPIRRSDAINWDKAIVLIDAKRFVPIAVKLYDTTDNETVHLFQNVEINPKSGFLTKDPFKPDLRRYKEAQTSDLQTSTTPAKSTTTKPAAAKAAAAGDASKRTANSADAPTGKKSGAVK